jgi:hypothetical protein
LAQSSDFVSAVPEESDVSVRKGTEEKILHDETDGRRRYQWASGYTGSAKSQIWCEAAFVCLVLIASWVGIYLTWNGFLVDQLTCQGCAGGTLKRYSYFFFSGMLGGVLFGGKYLYHVVARGYWHQDRRLWRILSPFLSASLAIMIAAAVDSGMLGLSFRGGSHAACVAMGFLSGYFADKALAKMSEIADVVFGVKDVGRASNKHESEEHYERDPS